MKTKTIEWWNKLPKTRETNVKAIEGDNVVFINGLAFLIQRTNEFNNIICLRVKQSRKSVLKTFELFRRWCEKKEIQYIRVEGTGTHRYRMLYLLQRSAPQDAGLIFNHSESKEKGRYIWCIKTY